MDEPQRGASADTHCATVLQHSTGFADIFGAAVSATFHPDRWGIGPRWERVKMLHYAVVFFIIALIAAVFGFGGIAAGAVGIAKVLFFVFLILAAVSLIANMARRT
jgi:uncharacterized membrane protein YtjA (UPF0391 family)